MTGTLVITHGPDKGTVDWDTEDAGGRGPLDPAVAEAAFDKLVRDGMFAFAVPAAGGTAEQVKRGGFDPQTQSRVTLTPQIAGGAS